MFDVAGEVAYGAFASVISAVVTHPLDTVKVRVQTGMYSSPAQCVKLMVRNEGVKSFYRGISAPLFVQPIYIGSSFGGLRLGQHLYASIFADPYIPDRQDFDLQRIVLSSAVATLTCAVCVTPGAASTTLHPHTKLSCMLTRLTIAACTR